MKKTLLLLLIFCSFLLASCEIAREEPKERLYTETISDYVWHYGYEITDAPKEVRWVIFHKDDAIQILQTTNNFSNLHNYMDSVHEIKSSIFSIYFALFYLLTIIAVSIYLYKNKKSGKIDKIVLPLFAILTLHYLVTNLINLSTQKSLIQTIFETL